MEKREGWRWVFLLILLLHVVVFVLKICRCIGIYLWVNFGSITSTNNSDAKAAHCTEGLHLDFPSCGPHAIQSICFCDHFRHLLLVVIFRHPSVVFSHCLAAHKYVGRRISFRTVRRIDVFCSSSNLISNPSSHPFYIPFINYFSKP